MSLKPIQQKPDIEAILSWLGPNGAKQGLLHSNLDSVSLLGILAEGKSSLSSKPSRDEIVHEIVFSRLPQVKLSKEALLRMTKDELVSYLKNTHPSRREIVQILSELGLRVGSEAKRNLITFAAGEISDMGVYERVSRKEAPKNKE